MDSTKPLIEQHYHIKDLIEAQEKRSADRTYYKDREKLASERNQLIRDTQTIVLTDFYCRKCDEDFKAQAIKEVEIDWTNPSQNIAFYKTKCWKGHWCIRLITDKFNDIYWFKSKSVARDRATHYKDLLQPFETGYNLLYGKPR